MPTPTELYQSLRAEAAALADLDAALGILSWDQEVNMPAGAARRRAQQLSTLAGLRHAQMTERLLPLAQRLHDALDTLDSDAALQVRQLWRSVAKSAKLPASFVAELTRRTSEAQSAWEDAKTRSDFGTFRPHLEHLVALKRHQAELYGYTDSPYDALLDDYEPGATAALLDGVFEPLKATLRPWVAALAQAPQVDDAWLTQPVARAAQWTFGEQVLRTLGYDFAHGRQDESMHPFSTSFGMEDVRITTRIEPNDIQGMLYSTIHECGHALYEQGLNPDDYGMPGAEACSLSIHESQSRIWENNVARGRAFCRHVAPQLTAIVPGAGGKTGEDLFRAVNKVQRSLIRIYADELTYHFHIVLRYELERALVEDRLQVAELPEAWNANVRAYLDLNVPDAAHGVLQDVHWSHGSFGYFPTYSLGSFYAAQFYHAAAQAHPDMEAAFAAGDFSPLRKWLAQHVWAAGRRYDSPELCRRATGQGLAVSFFLDYLRAKLQDVYAVTLPTEALPA